MLVNNAGIYHFQPIESVTEQEFHRQFGTNVLDPLNDAGSAQALTPLGRFGQPDDIAPIAGSWPRAGRDGSLAKY